MATDFTIHARQANLGIPVCIWTSDASKDIKPADYANDAREALEWLQQVATAAAFILVTFDLAGPRTSINRPEPICASRLMLPSHAITPQDTWLGVTSLREYRKCGLLGLESR